MKLLICIITYHFHAYFIQAIQLILFQKEHTICILIFQMIHIIYIFLYVEIKDSIKEFTITLIHIIYLSPYVDPCVKLNKNKN